MKTLYQLIEKYNRPGPRYTSYPPVPFWNNGPTEDQWIGHVRDHYSPSEGVDLYVHVPYCEKLCYYCGCNRSITKNHDVEDPFLKMLLKEWGIYTQKLGFVPRINSLHFGGGTPTFLSPQNLRTVIEQLTEERVESFIGSIEIDPRTCTKEHLQILQATGITRVSLGIQDFDPKVQDAIHRHQSVEMVEHLVEELRKQGFKSINFDLIYGLPQQNLKSISSTMEIAGRLRPDLIAFYGYAHLPGRIKNQRLINEEDLPSAELKRELCESGKAILGSFGYEDIGMDHFALPGSFLHTAKIQGKLHRNFMGYVDKKSSVLIGLGPTSISDSSVSFIQNAKEMNEYEEKINSGKLAIHIGHTHTRQDLLVQEIILRLMCEGEVKFSPKDVPLWEDVRRELQEQEKDGLLSLGQGHLKLTPRGKAFVRNVAMSFDFHLRKESSRVKFSQTI